MKLLSEVIRDEDTFARLARARADYRAAKLAEHGLPASVSCPDCGDGGHDLATGKPCWCAAGRAIRAAAERLAAWERKVPRRVRGFRLDGAPDREAARAVAGWLAEAPWRTGTNLVLMGPAGRGKTALGVAALWEAHEAGVGVALVNVGEWVDLMRETKDDDIRAEQDALERRAKRAELLLFDDLGAERETPYVLSRLYAVTNQRYDDGKATVVTTNWDHANLLDRYDQRIVDRLWERCVPVVMAGDNLRMRPAGNGGGR